MSRTRLTVAVLTAVTTPRLESCTVCVLVTVPVGAGRSKHSHASFNPSWPKAAEKLLTHKGVKNAVTVKVGVISPSPFSWRLRTSANPPP